MENRVEQTAITNATLMTPDTVIENGVLLIRDGEIQALGPAPEMAVTPGANVIDAAGLIVAPGLIDGQTHGGNGFDYMDAGPDEIEQVLRWEASTGVTGVLPTLATSSLEGYLGMLAALRQAQSRQALGAAILGFHIEGPYISQEKRGAQPKDQIRPPDIAEMDQIIQASGDQVRIVTLAPEIPGALELIRFLSARGIVPSLGHSAATYNQVVAAARAGLRRATHLYNGMTGFDHREPGAVGAVLTLDEVYAELILDGAHVHPVAAKIALRLKGLNRTVLVTDSTQAAGLGDGVYIRPGNRKITVTAGVARLESGTLAGSVLTLNRAVANAVQFMEIPLPQALALASRVAAESVGLQGRKGSLAPGKDADLIAIHADLTVEWTLVRGRLVYRRGEAQA